MKRACRRAFAGAALLATQAIAAPASAQDATTTAPAEPRYAERTLNGMTFVYPSTFDPTFVTTHFGARVGVAYANIPDVDVEGEKFDLALAGIREGFDLGIRLHERVGIFGEVGASALSGINVDAAFLSGATASLDWNAGVMGMLFRNERTATQVGARLRAFGTTGRSVEPLLLVRAILQQDELSEGSVNNVLTRAGSLLVSETHGIGFGGAVTGAQAIGRHVSLQGAVDLTHEIQAYDYFDVEAGDQEVDGHETMFGAGIAVGVSGHPFFPVGAQAEYRIDVPLDSTVDGQSADTHSQHFLGIGLQYTGRRALQLGLLAGTILSSEEHGETTIYGDLTMRYFF